MLAAAAGGMKLIAEFPNDSIALHTSSFKAKKNIAKKNFTFEMI